MNPLILRKTPILPLLVAGVLACLGLVSGTQAVMPPPDGGYPGGNTAEGQAALLSLTTGGFNTAVGFLSLRSNATTSFNTGVGAAALFANTAEQNTAIGAGALLSTTSGGQNTADGAFALFSNTTGDANTAVGDGALFANTIGRINSAFGWSALVSNTSGNSNTAVGTSALFHNTTGFNNTASGQAALFLNATGNNNTATGFFALSHSTGGGNTAIGSGALVNSEGDGNIALGNLAGSALTTGSNNIYIGHAGYATQNNSINIGVFGTHNATFVAGIHGTNTNGGIPVYIDASGQLGTTGSSRRFKTDVNPMDEASEAILALKPVTFHYKSDTTCTAQFGLIAEEVAEVNPNLVVRDKKGETYTVRYDAVNTMLLNEFLKAHKRIEEQEVTIAELKKELQATATQQQKQIEALTAGLEKVSAQLELNKPASQMVKNKP